MEKYTPSKRILEAICSEENLISQYTTFLRNQPKKLMRRNLTSFSFGIMGQLAFKYNLRDPFENIGYYSAPMHLSMELLKNAFGHGAKDRDIEFGLFLGDLGVCYGVKDGGDYFQSEDTKRIWECKSEIPNTTKGKMELSGFGIGVSHHIFPFSDMIEVDTDKGILYCVYLKSSFGKV